MFSLETHKNVPPKFSFALRDLAIFLGIFEMSEEELRELRENGSDTDSNMSHKSYFTQSAFKP